MSIFEENKWSAEEREYYSFIERCALFAEDTEISNSKPSHAIYLIDSLINFASEQVRIFTGKLTRKSQIQTNSDGQSVDLYADQNLIKDVCNFLAKDENHSISIVSENEIDGGLDTHPLILRVKELHEAGNLKGSFEVRYLNESQKTHLASLDFLFHFTIMDKSAYRLEYGREECKARANFGDVKVASDLITIFDTFHRKGSEVQLSY